jgi:ABC-type nitrate/sulfonate/bicarbonate transport system permease component
MAGNALRRWGPPAIVLALFIAAWQAAVTLLDIPDYELPAPLDIAANTIAEAPRLLEHLRSTVSTTLLGFAAGAAAGFLLAALLHLLPGARAGLYPLLVLSQNVPVMALGPLLVIWFGFGMVPRVLLVILVCFFPVVVAMLSGLTQTDRGLMNYMKMIGASRRQLFLRLELPASLPYLFSGLKLAASYSVISAIYAEAIGGSKGLGSYMLLSQRGFELTNEFSAIAVVILLSLLMFAVIAAAEKLVLRGRHGRKERGAA